MFIVSDSSLTHVDQGFEFAAARCALCAFIMCRNGFNETVSNG